MPTVNTQFKISAVVNGLNSVKALKNEVNGVSTAGDRMSRTVAAGSRALTGMVGTASTVFAAMALGVRADEMNILRGRVDQATRSVLESNQAWRGLAAISMQTGAEMGSTISVFQRLSYVRAEIKATADEMLQFTETVSKLGILSGATPDAMRDGLTQLGQALSSQYTRAEEFNSIMENIPAVGKAIADEFKITTGQLRLLVVDGQVLSKDVFAAMLNQTVKVREQFEEYPKSAKQARAQFAIAFGLVAQGLDQATGATKIWVAGINVATNTLMGIGKILEGVAYTGSAVFKAFFGVLNGLFARFTNFAYTTMNGLIEKANMLPGVEIDFRFQLNDPDAGARMIDDGAADLKKAAAAFGGAGGAFLGRNRGAAMGNPSTRAISQDYAKLASDLAGKDGVDKAAEKARKALEKLQTEFMQQGFKKVDFGGEAAKGLREYAKEAENVGKAIGDSLTGAFKGAEDAFVRFTMTGKLSFRDLASSIIEDLIRIQVRQSITGPLSGFLSGLFGSIGDSSLVSAAKGSSWGLGSVMGGMQGALRGYASGGSFTVPGNSTVDSSLVAFKARGGERVRVETPMEQRNAGGGVHVSVIVNADGSSSVSGSQDGRQLGNNLASAIKSVLMNEKRPGGLLYG